jgi:hypothetical protein
MDGMGTLVFGGGDPVNCTDPTGLEADISESRTFTKEEVSKYLRPWFDEFEQWRTIPKVMPGESGQLKQGLIGLRAFNDKLISAYLRSYLYPQEERDPLAPSMLRSLLDIAWDTQIKWELAYRGVSSVEQAMVCNLENNITDPNGLSILSMALSMGIKSSFTFKTTYNLSKPGRVGPAAKTQLGPTVAAAERGGVEGWLASGPKGGSRRNFLAWLKKGAKYDKYYQELNASDRISYMRGQRSFLTGFWKAHGSELEEFTSGLGGQTRVFGTVERGRYLRENYPIRSAFLNPIDLPAIRKTMETGPDPASRKLFMLMLGIDP